MRTWKSGADSGYDPSHKHQRPELQDCFTSSSAHHSGLTSISSPSAASTASSAIVHPSEPSWPPVSSSLSRPKIDLNAGEMNLVSRQGCGIAPIEATRGSALF